MNGTEAMGVGANQMVSVGQARRLIGRGCRAIDITNAFSYGRLREDLCPILGGRRLIPVSYLDTIADVLSRMGKLDGTVKGGTL